MVLDQEQTLKDYNAQSMLPYIDLKIVTEDDLSIQFEDFRIEFYPAYQKHFFCYAVVQGSKLIQTSKGSPLTAFFQSKDKRSGLALDHRLNVLYSSDSSESQFKRMKTKSATYRNCGEHIFSGLKLSETELTVTITSDQEPLKFEYTRERTPENTQKVLMQDGEYTQNTLVWINSGRIVPNRRLLPVFILHQVRPNVYTINSFMTDKWLY